MSASGAGECAVHSTLEEIGDAVAVAGLSVVNATTAGRATKFCWLKPDFANGCTGGAVFFCEVSQQLLFAQHPASHAFSLGAFERMHEAAEGWAGATKSAIASTADMPILLNIRIFRSTIRAAGRVERTDLGFGYWNVCF
jgi:hypothetical protein